jgi:hypothetical protein
VPLLLVLIVTAEVISELKLVAATEDGMTIERSAAPATAHCVSIL